MTTEDEFADALAASFVFQQSTTKSEFVFANFVAPETVDPNLSSVSFPDGTVVAGCPKGAHVTGLTAGDLLLCVSSGGAKPLIILQKMAGNPGLYTL